MGSKRTGGASETELELDGGLYDVWLFAAECAGVHGGGPVGMDTWHIAPRTKRHS